jgi:uncharacterized protein YgiM (DUF1202 family)
VRSLLLLTLLVTACTASPPPARGPAASPDPASPEVVSVPTERPASPSPVLAVMTTATQPSATASPTVAVAPTVPPTATTLPTPEPERLIVVGSGSPAVNMRVEPGTSSAVVKSVRDGTEVIVVGTDRESDGRIWRNVQDGDVTGWIVSTALRPQATPTVTPSSTPTLVATPTSVSPSATSMAPGASVTPAPSAAPTEPPAAPGPDGEHVEVFGTRGQGANLRAEPGTGAAVLQTVPDGTTLTVIGPDRAVAGRTWRNVRTDGGIEGWLVDEAVRSLDPPTPPPTETATPRPAATPTLPSTPTAAAPSESGASPTGTPTVTPTPAGTPSPPDGPPGESPERVAPEGGEEPTRGPERVEVYGTGGTGANLRARPGRTGDVLKSVPDGSQLTIVGEDEVADGVTWRNVQTEDGLTGWLATEVIKTVIPPTATPRPGSAGIGAPLPVVVQPESELTEEQRAARPCRPGQLKGDAATGIFYAPDQPDYPELLQRVRCFDDEIRARASGYRPPDATPEPSPSPTP